MECPCQSGLVSLLLFLVLCAQLSHQSQRIHLFKHQKFHRHSLAPGKTSLTEEEKRLIVDLHNAYRSVVEPPAADMRELQWDDDLEEYARNYSLLCTGGHSDRTMVKKWQLNYPRTWETWRNMGENLYYAYAPNYSVEEAIWMFWMEGQKYDITKDNCWHDKTCGHYKVMVYAKSSRIGCALNTCQTFSKSRYPTPAVFLVCEYDATFLDYKPYTVGERCSSCNRRDMGYSAQYCRHGLCVSPSSWFRKTGFSGDISQLRLGKGVKRHRPNKGHRRGKGSGSGKGRRPGRGHRKTKPRRNSLNWWEAPLV